MSEGEGRGLARGLSTICFPIAVWIASIHCNKEKEMSSFRVRPGYRLKCSSNRLRIHGSWDAGFPEGVAKDTSDHQLSAHCRRFPVYDLVLLCCDEEATFSWHGPGNRP